MEHSNDDLILAYHVRTLALELRDRAAGVACADVNDARGKLAAQTAWKKDRPIDLYLPEAVKQLKSISSAVKTLNQES